jgi:DNA-binding Xre family transcriptional regulator
MYKRKNINEVVNENIEQFGQVTVVSKVGERAGELGLNLRELSLLTGIRYASVNELANGKKVTLNLQHLLAIMVVLRTKSFDDLFEIQFEDASEESRFDAEAEQYRSFGLPDSELERIKDNAERLERTNELRKK